MKKIAFCISGQIRSFDALKLLNEEINRIKENFETKVFLSTWTKKGIKTAGAFGPNQQNRIFDEELFPYLPDLWINENNYSRFWSYFPKNLERINNLVNEDSSLLSKEAILELINVDYIDLEDENLYLEFEDWQKSNHIKSNSMKMNYKIWRCNALKKFHEKENDLFDIVISCRPDISISFKTLFNNLVCNDGEAFFMPPRNYRLNDMIRLSNSKTADLLSSIFSKTIESPNTWTDTHSENYDFCKSRNIKLKSIFDILNIKRPMTDKGELINFKDLILDYPELEEAYNDSKNVSNLPESLKRIAEGFHELIYLSNKKTN